MVMNPANYEENQRRIAEIDVRLAELAVERQNNIVRLRFWGLVTAVTMALLAIFAVGAQARANEPADTPSEACNAIGECHTEAEYAEIFSVDGLVASGTFTDPVDNGDGTVTLTNIYTGLVTVIADPLERPVAATPALEPDAPTVREILFPFRPFAWR